MIASIISQIAAPMLLTNREAPAASMPIMIIAIPQKNAPMAYRGKKISTNMPNAAAMPSIIKSMLPINAIIKPMLASVLEIYFTSKKSYKY